MFSLPGAASCSHTCTPLWAKEKKTPSLLVWFCTHRRTPRDSSPLLAVGENASQRKGSYCWTALRSQSREYGGRASVWVLAFLHSQAEDGQGAWLLKMGLGEWGWQDHDWGIDAFTRWRIQVKSLAATIAASGKLGPTKNRTVVLTKWLRSWWVVFCSF